ncbi:plasmid segregation protein ParM [Novimethylophilus kurashikiensis]|uniref:Plasmid segregation protein ParM n=1 Tax=Novimethylophilus kurashikiensis TaxID=1825523 RepID=A0A2R5F7Z1_9PROT|nr:PRTRC system protein D [Novimethylophilus kurashikiensis]GBG14336.1 plasmid segregation protein ParM [Novimethylophilus kurashikiensis]
MAKQDLVVRALDLGSGFVKLSKKTENGLEFMSFPSLAPRHTGRDLSMSLLGKRDTVVVTVEGTQYEVGPDSGDLDTNDATRNLNDQYIYTDQYKACFYGALHYMGESTIDLLVVGLPLTTLHRAADLKAMMEGTHVINEDETVTVKQALVLAQPMGGLHYCLSLEDTVPEFEFLRDETNLIIDPGYLTFDFLVTNGEKINDPRSSAHPGGVSKVLRAIAESISNKFGMKYDNLTAIDRAIERRRIKISGQVEDMLEHIRNARAAIEGSVNYLRNIAGDGSDIDNIILMGGGEKIFSKTILNYYKDHKIYVLPDAQLANVKGFQAAGEKFAGVPASQTKAADAPKVTVLTWEPPKPAQAATAAPAAQPQAAAPAPQPETEAEEI